MDEGILGIKSYIKLVGESIKDSTHGIKKLEGEPLKEFKDIFQIKGDIDLYFNDYNIVITRKSVLEQLRPYMSEKNLVLEIEIPEYELNVWIYQYFNDRIFNDYLK